MVCGGSDGGGFYLAFPMVTFGANGDIVTVIDCALEACRSELLVDCGSGVSKGGSCVCVL